MPIEYQTLSKFDFDEINSEIDARYTRIMKLRETSIFWLQLCNLLSLIVIASGAISYLFASWKYVLPVLIVGAIIKFYGDLRHLKIEMSIVHENLLNLSWKEVAMIKKLHEEICYSKNNLNSD